ncbi:MAG: hypothetical protein M3R27_11590 [Bacteroidota bacterium]|nr:hypothetical protein [Bacteroidota bacterium]
MEQTNTGAEVTAKRPTFLTVLCILSFVAAGIAVIASIIGYMGMAVVEGMGGMEGLANADGVEGMTTMPGMEDAMAMMVHAKTLLIVGIVITAIALFGVIQMWKQKKMGFYIYTGAQVIGIIIPIAIAGMVAFSALGLFFSIAFIVMYGLNLKHMN